MKEIGIPSVNGMTSALKSGAIGAVGGAVVGLSQKFFGTGIWGGLAGIAIAGSMLKGSSGEIVSTVMGFDIGKQIVAGGLGTKAAATSTASQFTMI
jgi:hypothetical protein